MREVGALLAAIALFGCADPVTDEQELYVSGIDPGEVVDRPKVTRPGTLLVKNCCTFDANPEEWERPPSDLISWHLQREDLEVAINYGASSPVNSGKPAGELTEIDGVEVHRSDEQAGAVSIKKLMAWIPVENQPDGAMTLPLRLEVSARCTSEIACDRADELLNSVRF
jgi:hypothetical protein